MRSAVSAVLRSAASGNQPHCLACARRTSHNYPEHGDCAYVSQLRGPNFQVGLDEAVESGRVLDGGQSSAPERRCNNEECVREDAGKKWSLNFGDAAHVCSCSNGSALWQAVFEDKYDVTQIAMLPTLYYHEAEGCLQAGGGQPGWVKAMEYNCGIHFRVMNDDKEDGRHATPDTKVNHITASKFATTDEPTLGMLFAAQGGKLELPAAVRNAPIKTEKPLEECGHAARTSWPLLMLSPPPPPPLLLTPATRGATCGATENCTTRTRRSLWPR